jgi:hypothetical protein
MKIIGARIDRIGRSKRTLLLLEDGSVWFASEHTLTAAELGAIIPEEDFDGGIFAKPRILGIPLEFFCAANKVDVEFRHTFRNTETGELL